LKRPVVAQYVAYNAFHAHVLNNDKAKEDWNQAGLRTYHQLELHVLRLQTWLRGMCAPPLVDAEVPGFVMQ
jgi:hypothetical protein